jgi:hypothetical protein
MWARRQVCILMLFLLVLLAAGVPSLAIDPSLKLPPEILLD